jgi:hypothetical protein
MSTRDEDHRRLERMYRSVPANEYFRSEIRIDEGTAEVCLDDKTFLPRGYR